MENPSFCYDTRIGKIKISENGNGKITFVGVSDGKCSNKSETPAIQKTAAQLNEYLNGSRKTFDVPIEPAGTEFQMRVWTELNKVPYGSTVTYGELAAKIGKPKAARAVGMAMNRNPIMIIQPCHRVIGSDGSLTGFAFGVDMKKDLLKLEGMK